MSGLWSGLAEVFATAACSSVYHSRSSPSARLVRRAHRRPRPSTRSGRLEGIEGPTSLTLDTELCRRVERRRDAGLAPPTAGMRSLWPGAVDAAADRRAGFCAGLDDRTAHRCGTERIAGPTSDRRANSSRRQRCRDSTAGRRTVRGARQAALYPCVRSCRGIPGIDRRRGGQARIATGARGVASRSGKRCHQTWSGVCAGAVAHR